MPIQRKEESLPQKRGPKFLFSTPKRLKLRLNDYFADCDAKNRPYTVTGMCIWLGTTRQTLWNYMNLHKVDQEIVDILTNARAKCELWLEEHMLTGSANTTGCIFSLKNNYGWRDRPEVVIDKDETETVSMLMEKRRAKLASIPEETNESSSS